MDTNEVSAEYIFKDKERLRMALHVYDAMPTVRWHLIGDIFKAAGERVKKELGVKLEPYEDGVYLWTEETGDCYVFAGAYKGKGPGQKVIKLVAGIYEAESIKEETRKRFATIDLETWSDGKYDPSDSIGIYVNDKHKGGRWDDDAFLRRAILHRDEVVKNVADLLIHIYKGMWPR